MLNSVDTKSQASPRSKHRLPHQPFALRLANALAGQLTNHCCSLRCLLDVSQQSATDLPSILCVQVCALQWNQHEKELLSSHGFSQNQLCLWRYPSMTKVRRCFDLKVSRF